MVKHSIFCYLFINICVLINKHSRIYMCSIPLQDAWPTTWIYTMLLYIISILVGTVLIYICNVVCPYCLITEKSLFTALSLVGFVLHCLLATWYKRRVREEDYDIHRVVEEVYDRYLSQRPAV